jgi:pyruvate/2-oxoglutarate/acetoin dehydrogenase E1 component/TPP-dependent pyruvate/acetoin dehydrogenase alpha subunit
MRDLKLAMISRQASLLGRKEVLTGKAKFGIFGDGKELAQLVMAAHFQHGDWRSGYYRDQTFMMAIGELTVRQFFAQLYADNDPENEPHSSGRQMNNHPATPILSPSGDWLDQMTRGNSSSDISPTGGQMPRLLGLAYASKLYRERQDLKDTAQKFTRNGQEVAFGTIGNASTSEGLFYETINAAGVLQVPMVMSVWDDGYGISVPQRYHTTKESISKALSGFAREPGVNGYQILSAKGWDYSDMWQAYQAGVDLARKEHVPALIHITEMTQPQGHSTSGSHERYKSAERLAWEEKYDCIKQFRQWILVQGFANEQEMLELEAECTDYVRAEKEAAWQAYLQPILKEKEEALAHLRNLAESTSSTEIQSLTQGLSSAPMIYRKTIDSVVYRALLFAKNNSVPAEALSTWYHNYHQANKERYTSHLHAEQASSATRIAAIPAQVDETCEWVDGRVVLRDFFHYKFAQDPRLFVIGEDVGFIGDVNQVFENLQKQFGENRCTDTGIRETTILGQGIGAALRGLRPIVDIQYLDYLLFCFQTMSDDLASLHYRTGGRQIAPVIVRTKGHRLEGIWHSGSPISTILGSIRGMHFCVPRNMTQAAGMYQTLMQGDEPALLIEVLAAYRLKERMPKNLGSYSVPLGVPEILRSGSDITVVTYGFNVRLAEEAAVQLAKLGVELEIIDVQTLLPFDLPGLIGESIRRTNAVIFFDEDVPGGATAYMMERTFSRSGIYDYLDAPPLCISAEANRPAYGSDGDYYCKSSAEDLMEAALKIMQERAPHRYTPVKAT